MTLRQAKLIDLGATARIIFLGIYRDEIIQLHLRVGWEVVNIMAVDGELAAWVVRLAFPSKPQWPIAKVVVTEKPLAKVKEPS